MKIKYEVKPIIEVIRQGIKSKHVIFFVSNKEDKLKLVLKECELDSDDVGIVERNRLVLRSAIQNYGINTCIEYKHGLTFYGSKGHFEQEGYKHINIIEL